MYVCLCNRYRDSQLLELAQSGVRCAHAAYQMLGHGPRCGRCLEFAQGLISSAQETVAEPLASADGGGD